MHTFMCGPQQINKNVECLIFPDLNFGLIRKSFMFYFMSTCCEREKFNKSHILVSAILTV